MARGKIIVDTARLDAAALQVERLAENYESEYNSLFGTVSELHNAWQGKDNIDFTNQISGFRDDFQRMTKLMRDYTAYLKKSAAAYRETQNNASAAVKNLSQGN